MKHRHHGHAHVAFAHGDTVGEQTCQRVQGRRAVAVDDALGGAGRARRVADAGGHPFVELRPIEIGICAGQKVIIAE